MAERGTPMKLCKDCVCRNQCGNDNVTFCAGYVKEVPTKWVTNEEFIRSCTTEELAGAIYEWHSLGYTRHRIGRNLDDATIVLDWLKEKHQ